MTTDSIMQTVPDYEQRLQAIAPEHSCIVRAPAGSGKTELLIQRYLKLLSLVEYPEEIIAITFTRKAAAEMQGRIIGALNRVIDQIPPQNDATRITHEIASLVLQQDRKKGWNLLQNPGRMRIQTIDSLCAWLTRQMPLLSGLGAQPDIIDDATELYREAAANTLAELERNEDHAADISVLLTHMDNNIPRLTEMLAGMLAKRDQWLRHISSDIRRDDLEIALRHVIESTLAQARSAFPKEYEIEFLECLRFATDNLAKEANQSPLSICQGIDHLPGVTALELPRWRALVDFCLTKNNGWRKRLTKNEGFPATDAGKPMKERFLALLARLSDTDLTNLLSSIRTLPHYQYSENEWQVINSLCRLLILANGKLHELFAETNQLDFTGFTAAAINALESGDAPTDLALYLDYRIRHILVDEFQDVSINQYRLIQQLTAGWAAEDGHTLFLVGDPMQSIYRFREAEVGLFIETWNAQRLDQVPLLPLQIHVNFRSGEPIVDWVNQSFNQILPGQSDAVYGAVSYEQATAFHRSSVKDAVQVHAFAGRDDVAEAQQVLELVTATRLQGSVAILVRNRTHLFSIITVLKQVGIYFRAVEIDALAERPVIQDLLALTMALHHCADRIAWLAILRAPWCGLTLNDLLTLAGDKQRTIWECMQDDKLVGKLAKDAQKRLLKVRAEIRLYFAEQRRLSLRQSVEKIWIRLGGPAALTDISDLVNARTYFELLEAHDTGGDLKQREKFIEQVSKLYAVPDVNVTENPVEVMTIHKAKGLEFDTVILPGLHRTGRHDESQLLIWTESPHGMSQDLLLAPIKETGQDKSAIYEYLNKLEKQKQQYESGRLLYVAVTRARNQLHLLGAVETGTDGGINKPKSGSLLSQLWPVVESLFKREIENSPGSHGSLQQGETTKSQNLLARLSPDWLLPPLPGSITWKPETEMVQAPDTLPEFEWASEKRKRVGTVIHRCIQLIADEGPGKWNKEYICSRETLFKILLRNVQVAEDDIDESCQEVIQALINITEDDRGRWILDSTHLSAENEFKISGIYRGAISNVKIDRTFIENGIRWVIDYKSGLHKGEDLEAFLDQEQERYQEQMEKYRELLKNLGTEPVRAALYFPLLKCWREYPQD